jgi:hypothetical protein
MLHLSVQDTTKHAVTNTGSDTFICSHETLRKLGMKIEPGPYMWTPLFILQNENLGIVLPPPCFLIQRYFSLRSLCVSLDW